MEASIPCSKASTTAAWLFPQTNILLKHNFCRFISTDARKCSVGLFPFGISAEQVGSKDVSTTLNSVDDPMENALRLKEWEIKRLQNEIAAVQGLPIRRWKPSRPPSHYEGPFEIHLCNDSIAPRNILEEIVWNKGIEVAKGKERHPVEELKKSLATAPPARDFVGSLKASYCRTGLPALIAEVKKASPSRGVLREDFNPVAIACAYEKGGASCLSVLTDERYFEGSFGNLEAIRSSGVKCPLLCKEFVIDPWQLYYARFKGADGILLIASVLPDLDIKYMIKICKTIGLTALVEVHNEKEIERAIGIEGIQLIGINNRDLGTFDVDICNTKKLLEDRHLRIKQRDIIVVGESGLFTPADISYVKEAGVKAVLVGESLVQQKDPGAAIARLFGRDISV